MKNVYVVVMLVALVLGGAGATPAQDLRLSAFALNCFVPTQPGLHTRASLVGKITLTDRTVRFGANCFDHASTSRFPDLQMSDGEVLAVEASVITFLENGTQQVLAQNRCAAHGRNGFLTLRCMASEADGGEVQILVSITPLPQQMFSAGTTP